MKTMEKKIAPCIVVYKTAGYTPKGKSKMKADCPFSGNYLQANLDFIGRVIQGLVVPWRLGTQVPLTVEQNKQSHG